jgi:hypothetical protein
MFLHKAGNRLTRTYRITSNKHTVHIFIAVRNSKVIIENEPAVSYLSEVYRKMCQINVY